VTAVFDNRQAAPRAARIAGTLAFALGAAAPVGATDAPIATDLLPFGQAIFIVGVRVTSGDGVDCPRVRTDDGQVYAVSYLEPAISIGDRVAVTGEIAAITSCRGNVIYVETAGRVAR
jgi:hypothetical protein